MRRCLQLASLGSPNVAPNPQVGCVIVYNGKIIGEGYHQKYGESHAEVNAINSVKDAKLLKESTLYVSLEPCSHTGKTPPCVNLILKNKIPKVVCAMRDPNPLVAGRGIQLLKDAGVEVIVDVLRQEAELLNKAFCIFHKLKRPFIVLKWARTQDGFIGRLPNESQLSKKISSPLADIFVHKLRAESGAILIGNATANSDNPTLTTRLWPGRNPIRLLFDPSGSVTQNANIFTDGNPTVVFGSKREFGDHIQFVEPDSSKTLIDQMMLWCYENGVIQVLVEGGKKTLDQFIEIDLWDEAFEIVSPTFWERGVKAPTLRFLSDSFTLDSDKVYQYMANHQ